MRETKITPELLLSAYAAGIFPMAEGRDNSELFWVDPRLRGILPLDGLHISRSLRKHIRTASFDISFDRAFQQVVKACADREETWINAQIEDLYNQLSAQGHAHSVEVWQDGALAGGVYGVSIGGAFFGESMFSQRTNASKTALVFLLDRLRAGGFALFDTQFLTDHLASLGAVEISRNDYHRILMPALALDADFDTQPKVPSPYEVLQRNNQMS
jgi:leucyl/phenylalanyl-tRNA--protein transferase